MRHEFRVVFTPIEDGWILAQAPELPGAVTQGETLEEARAMIKEASPRILPGERRTRRTGQRHLGENFRTARL